MALNAEAAEKARQLEGAAAEEVKKHLTELRKKFYYGNIQFTFSLQGGVIRTARVAHDRLINLKTNG